MMLDAALALNEAGVQQLVVTRGDSARRLAQLAQAGVPVETSSFDKFWRFPTTMVLQRSIDRFQPNVLHYWMGRAGAFAPRRTMSRSLGWYGGYYKLSRFRNCAWHAGLTNHITQHIIDQGADPGRVVTLPTYARIHAAPPLDRASLGTPDSAPVVLALARLHWKKGLDVLLAALARLPGVHGWIAGAGPLEEELRAQALALGVADRVKFLGWRDDRSALLGACDVVAFPSRYEPFGAVTIEAWAARRPLVVADAAGPAATVTHEQDALLIPKDNVEALAVALKRVLDDGDLAARLVQNGWRAYQARFTQQAFTRAAMALYERIDQQASEREGSIARAAAVSGAA